MAKSEQWNRGNYLVNALGHCGECHTPRNLTIELDISRVMLDNVVDGFEANDISPSRLQAQGWTEEDLSTLFRQGYSAKGTVFGEMSLVISHSLSKLNAQDVGVVTRYLLDSEQALESKPVITRSHDKQAPGHNLYVSNCSGCHGLAGQGKPRVAPAMQSNATINRQSIYNSVAVLLCGIPSQRYSATSAFYAMDSFADLSDQNIADLINYMRSAWTDETANVNARQVASIRAELRDLDIEGRAEH